MTKIRFDRATGLAAAALFAFALPANAANTTSNSSTRPAADASQRTDNNSARRICVRLQQGGSRISRPVCKTAQEWETAGGVPSPDR